jgi:TM2 domain-containing membrane protein YozV
MGMSAQHLTPPRPEGGNDWPSAPTYGQSPQGGLPFAPAASPRQPQRPVAAPAKSFPIAWALSLFLGVWGADRFYLGKWKSGLLKLFTAGGLFLWWLIDLVLLSTGRVKDAKGRPLQQFDTMKWAARAISGAVVAGFIGLTILSATTETPPPTEVAGGETAVLEEAAAPTEEPGEEPTTEEPTTEAPTSEAPTTEAPTSAAPTTTAAPTPTPEPEAAEGTALAQLAGLEVKGRGSKTDYDRDLFGWRDDMDRNGCDTRNDILRRDLTGITLKGGTGGCVVLRGTLDSPYSGETVAFDRENNTIDIDHVVALSDAWQTGAMRWDEQTMREFANDPLNLLAVESSLNRQKGDGDAATWLPPAKDYRCEYVARQIAVKDKYDLWVKPAEADAMERVLGDCEGFLALEDDDQWPAAGEGDVVATESEPAPAPATTEPEPAPAPAPKKSSSSSSGSSGSSSSGSSSGGSSGGGDVYYKNCTAAREAGAAPVHRGDPGYDKHLDRDGDGVGCE